MHWKNRIQAKDQVKTRMRWKYSNECHRHDQSGMELSSFVYTIQTIIIHCNGISLVSYKFHCSLFLHFSLCCHSLFLTLSLCLFHFFPFLHIHSIVYMYRRFSPSKDIAISRQFSLCSRWKLTIELKERETFLSDTTILRTEKKLYIFLQFPFV